MNGTRAHQRRRPLPHLADGKAAREARARAWIRRCSQISSRARERSVRGGCQPSDATTGGLDVIAQRYSAAGGAIKAEGSPEPFLLLTKLGTSLALISDAEGRLWAGGPAASGTRFVVLD